MGPVGSEGRARVGGGGWVETREGTTDGEKECRAHGAGNIGSTAVSSSDKSSAARYEGKGGAGIGYVGALGDGGSCLAEEGGTRDSVSVEGTVISSGLARSENPDGSKRSLPTLRISRAPSSSEMVLASVCMRMCPGRVAGASRTLGAVLTAAGALPNVCPVSRDVREYMLPSPLPAIQLLARLMGILPTLPLRSRASVSAHNHAGGAPARCGLDGPAYSVW